jgi:hypothetical protein
MNNASLATTDPSKPTPSVDGFLYDSERLREIASDEAIKCGLGYFKENRVYDLDRNQDQLWAMVEGLDSEVPFAVELKLSGNGSLLARSLSDLTDRSEGKPICFVCVLL